MTDLRTLLQEGDPILREGDISRQDASRMRAQILSATDSPHRTAGHTLTAVLATGLILAVVASGWLVLPDDPDAGARPAAATRQQLQISTPGGTRVIWIFNSELDVR